ncbi:hypothetical protein U1Q18_011213 [Sarracenia purpurea var. burkii]
MILKGVFVFHPAQFSRPRHLTGNRKPTRVDSPAFRVRVSVGQERWARLHRVGSLVLVPPLPLMWPTNSQSYNKNQSLSLKLLSQFH